jgi:hypothetical protein
LNGRNLSALIVASFTVFGLAYTSNSAYAHDFSGDESASFLALVESIKVELMLVQTNAAANATLAEEHAEHAHHHLDEHTIEEISERNERLGEDLPAALEALHDSVGNATEEDVTMMVQGIDDLLAETVTVRIDSEQRNNVTVWALTLAAMADGVNEHYRAAYGIETEGGGHGDDEQTSTSGHGHTGDATEGDHGEIVDFAQYQSSLALANRTLHLFNDQVKSLTPVVSVIALVDLEEGLEHLVEAVEGKETTADVEVILHTQVHPNLQKAYGLKLDSHSGSESNIRKTITLDGKTYEVTGKSAGANLTAIDIDPNKSVELTFEGSGEVELSLPVTMIEGINMVQTTDGHMLNYTTNQTASTTTITFVLDENMTSVEVMGAMVVPEFPLPILIVLPAIVTIIAVTRTRLIDRK